MRDYLCQHRCRQVDAWRVSSSGLLLDRHWMIINANGVCMTQKRLVKLCRIQTSVDLVSNVLVLSYPGLFTFS